MGTFSSVKMRTRHHPGRQTKGDRGAGRPTEPVPRRPRRAPQRAIRDRGLVGVGRKAFDRPAAVPGEGEDIGVGFKVRPL